MVTPFGNLGGLCPPRTSPMYLNASLKVSFVAEMVAAIRLNPPGRKINSSKYGLVLLPSKIAFVSVVTVPLFPNADISILILLAGGWIRMGTLIFAGSGLDVFAELTRKIVP